MPRNKSNTSNVNSRLANKGRTKEKESNKTNIQNTHAQVPDPNSKTRSGPGGE